MLENAASFLATLGHSDRLKIVCELIKNEKSVTDLANQMQISQSSLSQHLGKLREIGAVESRKVAQTVYYRCTSDQVKSVLSALNLDPRVDP